MHNGVRHIADVPIVVAATLTQFKNGWHGQKIIIHFFRICEKNRLQKKFRLVSHGSRRTFEIASSNIFVFIFVEYRTQVQ